MCNGIIVEEFNISGNLLTVSARTKDGEPANLRIIFTCGDNIRILPLLPEEEKGKYSYTYLLDSVYTEMPDGKEISVTFETLEGGDYREIPAASSEKLNSKLKKVNIYGRKLLKFPKYIYTYDVKHNGFTIKCSKNKNFALKSIVTILRILFGILAFILSLFVLAVSCFRELKNLRKGLQLYIKNLRTDVAIFLRKLYNDEDVTARVLSFFDRSDKKYFADACRNPIVNNRVAFVSGRRDELTGNEKFVYDRIKDDPSLDIVILTSSQLTKKSSESEKQKFYDLYATSRVVIVDDHFTLLDVVKKRDGVYLFQLWHACGAFKTFGFSRLGKSGGPIQTAPTHRMYDFAVVSSGKVARNYAEGFGISPKNILPCGVPRTDVFFDNEYRDKVRNKFFNDYPLLKGKKIILFAPTFRGNGKDSAYYDISKFEPAEFIEKTGGEYALLIKLHPFCNEKFDIPEKYKDCIIDMSGKDELNDLLFVTDLLITDYSSCVFEASLLDIPMLFYAYDLDEYVADRDFYCEFRPFVPGHIAGSFDELVSSVNNKNYEFEKVKPFRNTYFGTSGGRASQLVADKILEIIKANE